MGKILKILTQTYARVVGYYRPISQFNIGKKQEWNDRELIKDVKTGKENE